MMKILSFTIMAVMVALNYQNCSPSHKGGSGALNIASLYPYYDQKPTYFDNIQLTKTTEGSGGAWLYEFSASVAVADNPLTSLYLEIQILDENDVALCTLFTATVNLTNNNMLIDNCQSTHKVTKAKIQISARLTTETQLNQIKSYILEF